MQSSGQWEYTGKIRVHFNRKEEAPLLASITPAELAATRPWEVLARSVHICAGVVLTSGGDLNGRPGLDPIWWLETYCSVMLGEDGCATLYVANQQPG